MPGTADAGGGAACGAGSSGAAGAGAGTWAVGAGVGEIVVVRLEAGDVSEDAAAASIAQAVAGDAL